MPSPYPLQENDAYSYGFTTSRGITYKVYFLDYSYMFANYPQINCPIYSFNIEATAGQPDQTNGDERVGATVASVLYTFFSNVENVAVYVCDGTDDREYARKRKFDVWFLLYNDGSIIKEDGIAMVEGTRIYNALLVHSQNKQKDHLLTVFKELNGKASDSK